MVLAEGAGISPAQVLARSPLAGLRCEQLGASDFQEIDGVLASWFQRHAAIAAIVRPDHYVYGVAGTLQALGAQLGALTLH